MIKKLSILSIAIVFSLTLSGCGNKPSKTSKGDDGSKKPVLQEEKAPAPTGKVDDTVDAIIDEANKESDLVTGADSVAKDAINDSQETDDLSKAYDENEF